MSTYIVYMKRIILLKYLKIWLDTDLKIILFGSKCRTQTSC